MSLTKKILTVCVLICVAMTIQSCGARRSPIERISANLKNVPEYTVILEDMESRGSRIQAILP